MDLEKFGAIAAFLQKNKDAIQTAKDIVQPVLAAGGLTVGWYYRRRAKRINLVIDSKDGFAVLFNSSLTAIEVTGCSAEIFDITQPAALAKKQAFICSPCGLVKPGDTVRMLEFKSFEGTIEKLLKAEVEGLRRSGIEMPRFIGIRIYVTYRRADSGKVERARFARHLSGHPTLGWGLSYSPYHGQSRAKRHLKRAAEFYWNFARSPRAALKQREGMKYLQRHLGVMSTLRAVQDDVLSTEQAEKRLEKLLKKKGDALTTEVTQILENQRRSQESIQTAPKRTAGSQASESPSQ